MMLTDYTFMDDNNPKYLDDNDTLINSHRVQLIGAKMREFSNYQTNSYKSIHPFNPSIPLLAHARSHAYSHKYTLVLDAL